MFKYLIFNFFFFFEFIDNVNLKCGFIFFYIEIIFFLVEVRKFLRKREEFVFVFI